VVNISKHTKTKPKPKPTRSLENCSHVRAHYFA